MMIKRTFAPVAAIVFAVCAQPAFSHDGDDHGASGAMNHEMAKSGTYVPDPTHRYITFSYVHQGYSHPMLRWREWDASLNWNAQAPEESSISVTIDANSIDSGVDVFDEHLIGDKFFDTANYPEITFVSTGVEKADGMTGKLTGDLTMKGVTKPVTLDVTFNKGAHDERKGIYKVGFSGATTINRSEFELGVYVPMVSDEVDIMIEAEFTMPDGSAE